MPPGFHSLSACTARPASAPVPALLRPSPVSPAASLPTTADGADVFLPRFRVSSTPKITPGENSHVLLDCPLQGWDAVEIEGRRGPGGWELLAVCLKRKFTDTRPPLVAGQPEVRDYRCRFREGDETQELYSDVVRVTTKP